MVKKSVYAPGYYGRSSFICDAFILHDSMKIKACFEEGGIFVLDRPKKVNDWLWERLCKCHFGSSATESLFVE
jgi:hypothetical protein